MLHQCCWKVIDYPYDDLLAAAADKERTNVDAAGSPAPATVIINDYLMHTTSSAEQSQSSPGSGTSSDTVGVVCLNNLHGATPGLNADAVQRVKDYLDQRPGLPTVQMCRQDQDPSIPPLCENWPAPAPNSRRRGSRRHSCAQACGWGGLSGPGACR